MVDYKGHVGAPAKCHLLYGKSPAWMQLNTIDCGRGSCRDVLGAFCRDVLGAFCWADGGRVSKSAG